MHLFCSAFDTVHHVTVLLIFCPAENQLEKNWKKKLFEHKISGMRAAPHPCMRIRSKQSPRVVNYKT